MPGRKFRDIVSRLEGSHRGLVRLLGKQVWEKSHREFESRPLRIFSNLSVDRAYNSNIENGRMNPTLSTLEKIANALGISSSELLK